MENTVIAEGKTTTEAIENGLKQLKVSKDKVDIKVLEEEKKSFFKDFKAELKKVIWPTPKQLVNNTVAVITIVLITAIIVFVLDFTFEKLNTYGVNNLKKMVKSENEVTNELAEENTDSNEIEETNTEETESSEEVSE